MSRTFLTADLHFGHVGVCKFTTWDPVKLEAVKLRPWDDIHDMNAALVDNWNRVVRPEDKVYVLGDVCMSRKHLSLVGWCNGRKVLIKGNHDTLKPDAYLRYFDDIRAYKVFDDCILSHIPLHPSSLGRFKRNIHGHLHNSTVVDDDRYICVSVERTGYFPVDYEVIRKTFTND